MYMCILQVLTRSHSPAMTLERNLAAFGCSKAHPDSSIKFSMVLLSGGNDISTVESSLEGHPFQYEC